MKASEVDIQDLDDLVWEKVFERNGGPLTNFVGTEAVEVLERMRERGWSCSMRVYPAGFKMAYWLRFSRLDGFAGTAFDTETFGEAVCRAALAAIEEEGK